jgi:hypothetical protein
LSHSLERLLGHVDIKPGRRLRHAGDRRTCERIGALLDRKIEGVVDALRKVGAA